MSFVVAKESVNDDQLKTEIKMTKQKHLFRSVVGEIFASLCSQLLYFLRNRKRISLTREEFRALSLTFSAYGEDLVVLSYFNYYGHEDQHSNRVYVDVGAYDPAALSTTLLMHKLGWKGVNVDLDAEKIARFAEARPHDHNVVAAVSDQRKTVRCLKYDLSTTNRIQELSDTNLTSLCNEQPHNVTEIETLTLTEILDASPFRDRKPDYLNVDCEGHDLEVLKGLDYERYAPSIITVEAFSKEERKSLQDFLRQYDYGLAAVLRFTLVFVKGLDKDAALD